MAEEPGVSQEAQGSYIAQATGGGHASIQVYASPPSLENQNRARFLVRLRTRYRDLLSQSLHGAVRLMLELAGYPDAVTPPVRLLSQPDQQPARPLPAGTSLSQVYADAGHELLVLGEPGAGKSTLLLELALDLVGMAERDHSQLLPVIVPLSSWTSKRRPLEQWLAEQIALLYDLPRRLSERWVREERLLPLLDGLDEMDEEARAICIAAINAYHREHLHPLVVASRKAEYEAAVTHARLVLHRAVTVQPLTLVQIEAYLEQAGEPLHALRAALHRDATLRELTSTPLMLSILTLTYHGLPVEELLRGASPTDRQRQIFEHYVERMLRHRGDAMRYPHERTMHWLAWLARQMKQHNQTVFYIEHLQPDWLPEGRARSWYERLATRGAGIVIGVVVSLLVTTLFFEGVSLPNEIWYGCAGGLVGGLISGSGTSGFQLKGIRHLCFQRWRYLILLGVLNGVLVGGFVAAGFALWGSPYSPYDWLIYGGSLGLCGSLLAIIIVSGKRIAQQGISSVPRQYWWHGFLPQGFQSDHLRLGIMVGLLLGLSDGLSTGLSEGLNYALYGLSVGLIFGTIGVFLSLLLLGRKSTIELAEILVWSGKRIGRSLVSKHHLSASARLLLLAFLFFGLSVGLPFGLSEGLSVGLSTGLSEGLSEGLTTAALLFGKREGRETMALLFFRYFRYDCKSAAMCSKRSMVTSSLTPMYLL